LKIPFKIVDFSVLLTKLTGCNRLQIERFGGDAWKTVSNSALYQYWKKYPPMKVMVYYKIHYKLMIFFCFSMFVNWLFQTKQCNKMLGLDKKGI